jgi:hypothetical protein
MTSRTKLKRKEVDDVLGGEEMWKHADSTAGNTFSRLDFHHNAQLKNFLCDSFMRQMQSWQSLLPAIAD